MESHSLPEQSLGTKAQYLALMTRIAQKIGKMTSHHPNIYAIELGLAIMKVHRESGDTPLILREFCKGLKKTEQVVQTDIPDSTQEKVGNTKGDVSKESKALMNDEDMLLLAGEMKNVAGRVHSTLRRDKLQLSMTADLQEVNIARTSQQRSIATNVASSKKIGFFLAIWMVASSAIIFVVLAFIIVVIT